MEKKYTHIQEINYEDGETTHFLIGSYEEFELDLRSDLWFNEISETKLQRKNKIEVHDLDEVFRFMDEHGYSYREHMDGTILKIGGSHDMNLYPDLTFEWEER